MNIPEFLLFLPTAFSCGYIALFAGASLRRRWPRPHGNNHPTFHIIIPAYAEDAVIGDTVRAVIGQTYPAERRHVTVVADHMQPPTIAALQSLPVDLRIATYQPSTKGKALQLALDGDIPTADYAVILDADNIVRPDFLARLAMYCNPGTVALQCHRCAKNTDTPTALLDAVSEEVNNSIFRQGHNSLGLSSALIGSGMCLDHAWLRAHVGRLQTSGEDKELETMLLAEGHHITYLADIPVFDEKVKNREGFSRQRRRWMAAQLAALAAMTRRMHWHLDYIDKTVQQMLVPRSMCLLITAAMFLLTQHAAWLVLLTLLILSMLIALPRHLIGWPLAKAVAHFPTLALSMVWGLLHLHGESRRFTHTQHGEAEKKIVG